ncbi:hypothetical protein [Capnocytophaga canimorsus]|uniref:hypothetical protein n=1 Tax=Capnocytophaga canimorsus TaxID=28188 RepID=UPI0037D89343
MDLQPIGWLMRLSRVFIIFTGLLLLVAYSVIFYVLCLSYQSNSEDLFIVLFLFGATTLFFIFGIRKIVRLKTQAIMQIYVDEIGLHYVHRDGNKTSFLYDKFQKSDNRMVADVFHKTIRRGKYIVFEIVFFYPDEKDNVRQQFFQTKADALFAYIFTRNEAELRAFFIKNIAQYRPDLQIDKDIFKCHYINEKTLVFDRAKRKKTTISTLYIILIVTIVLVFLIIIFFELWLITI